MDISKQYKYYKYGELLYKKVYRLYQLIYFSWKKYTERDKIKFLQEYIKPGMSMVDVGANIGFYSTILLKMAGEKGKVYSFEPDKTNFRHLVSNTRKFKNSITNNIAVSDKSGKVKLYRYPLNVEFKTYDMMGESVDFTEIDCVSLDDYFKNGELINVIKTDTEGYDYFVIKGMRELVKRSQKLVLITEFWPFMLKQAGVNPGDFIALLEEMGFALTFVDPQGDKIYDQMVSNRLYYTDIIAIKQ